MSSPFQTRSTEFSDPYVLYSGLAKMSDVSQDPGLGPGVQRPSVNGHTVTATPEGRASEFVAVSGAESESTSAMAMLVTAYSVFWALLLGFIWLTWRRQQSLATRLQVIEARIANLRIGETK